MDVLEVEGVTGLIDTNYEGKVRAALEFLQEGDFVYVHVEAPDECGHGGDLGEKMRAIDLPGAALGIAVTITAAVRMWHATRRGAQRELVLGYLAMMLLASAVTVLLLRLL